MKVLKKTGTIVISVLLWLVILVAALYAFTTIATRDNQQVDLSEHIEMILSQ